MKVIFHHTFLLSFEGFIGLGPSLEGYDKKWRVFASRSGWASLEGIKELLNCREAAYLNKRLELTSRTMALEDLYLLKVFGLFNILIFNLAAAQPCRSTGGGHEAFRPFSLVLFVSMLSRSVHLFSSLQQKSRR